MEVRRRGGGDRDMEVGRLPFEEPGCWTGDGKPHLGAPSLSTKHNPSRASGLGRSTGSQTSEKELGSTKPSSLSGLGMRISSPPWATQCGKLRA